MNILWITWKDLSNPDSGGAEVISELIAEKLVRNGHQVKFVVAGYKNCRKYDYRNGYTIIRIGNKYTVYLLAPIYVLLNIRQWHDLVIEEINTIPFFTKLYALKPRILFFHQLCREIWFYQLPYLVGVIGYLLEPLYLYFLRSDITICVSKSTKNDLERFGFERKKIHIISEAIKLKPIKGIDSVKKFSTYTILAFGSVRSMKRTLDQVRAFELAKKRIPELNLIVAGNTNSKYGAKVKKYILNSEYSRSITILGNVSDVKKKSLLGMSHLLLVTSVKEGWCLVVSEANSQGTPAIGYSVDGIRDSIINGKTGILTSENTPESLAEKILKLYSDKKLYRKLSINALNFSKGINIDNCYKDFFEIISKSEK